MGLSHAVRYLILWTKDLYKASTKTAEPERGLGPSPKAWAQCCACCIDPKLKKAQAQFLNMPKRTWNSKVPQKWFFWGCRLVKSEPKGFLMPEPDPSLKLKARRSLNPGCSEPILALQCQWKFIWKHEIIHASTNLHYVLGFLKTVFDTTCKAFAIIFPSDSFVKRPKFIGFSIIPLQVSWLRTNNNPWFRIK